MLSQEWWQSLTSEKQTIAVALLTAILKGVEELKDGNHEEVARWILYGKSELGNNERESFLDEFTKRCEFLLDDFLQTFEKENIREQSEIFRRIEMESRADIEVKATVLGLLLKQSNMLANLAEICKKIVTGTVVDHEGDLKKLEAQGKRLEALIKLYQHQQEVEETVLFEWEIDLDGCPNLECQEVNPSGSDRCHKCGVSLIGECPNCYNELRLTSSYCKICGAQHLENWKMFSRFVISAKIAIKKNMYNKAANLLVQIPEQFANHPDTLDLKMEVKKKCDEEFVEQMTLMKNEIMEKVESLREKWTGKIRAMLAENRPDFVLASSAFERMPVCIVNKDVQDIKAEMERRQEQIVDLSRQRKRTLLLERADVLKEQGNYEGALSEICKITGLLEDERTTEKRQEIEHLLAEQQKIKSLQEGYSWSKPSAVQKEKAVEECLPVALEFELEKEVKLCFILIPAGSFKIGNDEGYENEKPAHPVTISKSFYLAVTPTTQEQWEAMGMENRSSFRGPKLPVQNVTWDESGHFLVALNKKFGEVFRLPTETEWEYACRAGSESFYCFGDMASLLDEYAWFNKNSGQQPHEVSSKNPNAWSLFDMHGNVWEWCQDCYLHDYYTKSPIKDPMGVSMNKNAPKVCRGGSWKNVPSDLRCSMRHGESPSYRDSTLGFRALLVISKNMRKKA